MIPGSPSISEAVERIRQGRLSPVELVEACLRRIERYEPQVRAWVLVDAERAVDHARQLEADLPRLPEALPLLGIPLGIKDIIDVRGLPTRGAWPGSDSRPASQDAPVVARLRQAGAIILGKTVTTQLACFDPPPTRNPWNPQHTPGGSSSGSAAAVAMSQCLGALGSQTGGSITRPASYCGICGLKPRFESLSRVGVLPISEYLDHVGPMAARISDLARLWQALMPSQQDLAGQDAAGQPSMRDEPTGDDSGAYPLRGADDRPTLALVDGWRSLADPAITEVTDQAIQKLRDAGAAVVSVDLPPLFDTVLTMHRRLMAVGMATTYGPLEQQEPDSFGPSVRTLIEEASRLTAVEFSEALRYQLWFREQLARRLPPSVTLLSPSTVTAAPASLTTTGDPRFNSPWSFAGLPTCTLPIGLTGDSMPAGLQLIGTCNETQLLRRAAWCERILGFSQRHGATEKDSQRPGGRFG